MATRTLCYGEVIFGVVLIKYVTHVFIGMISLPFMKPALLLTLSLLGAIVTAPAAYGYHYIKTAPGSVHASSNARALLEDARAGDVDAMRLLGKQLIDGTTMKRDLKNGVLWLKKAVEAGDDRSMVMLGDLYYHGRAVSQNRKKALELYMQAAEANNKNALKRLEKMPLNLTLDWWEERADDGDKKAVLKLMKAYASGKGVAQNIQKARKYFEIADKKWPKAAEKALAKMPEDVKESISNSGDYLALIPVKRIEEKYYINGTEDECKKRYISDLERVKSGLIYVSWNKQEMGTIRRFNDIVGCYASAELCRLTLISKYGVSPKELELSGKELRKEIKQKCDSIQASIDWDDIQAGDMECLMAIGFLTQGGDEENRREMVYRSSAENCLLFFARITAGELKKVTSASRGSAAMQAAFAGTYHKLLGDLIAATSPGLCSPKPNYNNVIQSIKEQVNRISRAGYYGDEIMEDYVRMIRKSYNFN